MKAIYQPTGKAAEYAKWACNFYVGCSNRCTYCYCKKGILAGVMGGDKPTLKKCFKNTGHALNIFSHEIYLNKPELQKHGVFFSFTTDPLLPETYGMTWTAISSCHTHGIPVKVLTKIADGALKLMFGIPKGYEQKVAIGFTLTGHDELEPGASTNDERIEAMRKLHDAGFKTWASIEPIVDFDSSYRMIGQTAGFCDLYKIGLMSGKRITYTGELRDFFVNVTKLAHANGFKIYWKDSIRKLLPIIEISTSIGRDYNIFQEAPHGTI
jgi:DNA repair photolyase